MRNSKGHFVKGNEEGFTTTRKQSLTAQVSIRLIPQVKEKLKSIPDWQKRVRDYIENIIKDDGE
ncbi:hypothetical protein IQ247_11095 [Plectonema cf. radiosum LEGE 06105]|uniref:Uncharacterized protein n=1 Tax=Plectonema cf. radiosum LEGE 06105 TaxID=945769 RepID=A0A8J7F3B4_9CYAN|nr:hypothetical protein [Plectonema radiosum]MBE9213213.1 hypothetical protein [Plectonema cf. radiosum LEGE 06105]